MHIKVKTNHKSFELYIKLIKMYKDMVYNFVKTRWNPIKFFVLNFKIYLLKINKSVSVCIY